MRTIVCGSWLLSIAVSLLVFAANGAAQDKPLRKIYWGVSTLSPTLWIPWIAKEAKIFERNGLDVEAVLLNGSGRTSQAMLSGVFCCVGSAAAGDAGGFDRCRSGERGAWYWRAGQPPHGPAGNPQG